MCEFVLIRKKWWKNDRNLQVGDIVMFLSLQNPRGTWLIGRVIRTIIGADKVVRSVWIWVNGTELHRPVVDLSLLEAGDSKTEELEPDYAFHPAESKVGDVPASKQARPAIVDSIPTSEIFNLNDF